MAADGYLVEILLDTGQRYQSVNISDAGLALRAVDDFRGLLRVVAVSMIRLATGEVVTRPSRNLTAQFHCRATDTQEREALAEAFGA